MHTLAIPLLRGMRIRDSGPSSATGEFEFKASLSYMRPFLQEGRKGKGKKGESRGRGEGRESIYSSIIYSLKVVPLTQCRYKNLS